MSRPWHILCNLARPVFRLAVAVLCLAACDRADTDYARAFVELHPEQTREVDERALKQRVLATLSGGLRAPTGLSGVALARDIARRTNIEFLIDEIGAHYHDRVTVTLALVTREADHATYRLSVRDPALPAPIDALVVAPAAFEISDDGARVSAGRASAVVLGLHGHDQDPDAFRTGKLGNELAARGFVVIIPDFELFDCSASESATSALLLEHGFTLIGIRVYQSLALIELARGWSDSPRVGILAHSGGSALARLISPLSERVAARVVDYRSLYNDLCEGQIHCETVPDLYEISGDINAPDAAPQTLSVPYGFDGADTRAAILRLFEDVL